MKRTVFSAFSTAILLSATPSFAAYDFKVVDYPGAAQTMLIAVNDLGVAVGQLTDAANDTHPFVWADGRFSLLDPDGVVGKSAAGHAYSINALGTIAGSYADASNVLHGYVRRGRTTVPVEYPGGLPTEAYGVNDREQVIGVYTTPDGNTHAFELAGGVYVAEDVPGSITTVPLSINDRGQIVGFYLTVAGTIGQGYVREPDGTFRTYNAPDAAANSSFLISVNNVGEAVGGYADASGNVQNILLVGGDIEDLAVPTGYAASYQSFQTINDLGEIVGYFDDAAGASHGFIALPALH